MKKCVKQMCKKGKCTFINVHLQDSLWDLSWVKFNWIYISMGSQSYVAESVNTEHFSFQAQLVSQVAWMISFL